MGLTAGAATRATEQRKHEAYDGKCRKHGCVCVPMIVVDAYGAWGAEAMESSRQASHLATKARAAVLNSLYGRLNLNLVKSNATAMLSRCFASDM